jgi:predicted  nucleic acid-binding Zn-ribbon protein
MSDNVTDLHENSKHSIEQIRDIIFGEQIAEYKKMISHLTKECSNLKKRLDNLEKKYEDEIKRLTNENSSQHTQLVAKQDEIMESVTKLKEEFDRKYNELIEQKVDKSEIGQAFIDWGMKVKKHHV